MVRFGLFLFLSAVLTIFSGCYQYAPPPAALESTVLSQENREESNQLLAANKVLTLKLATEIALKNNPNLRAALHAVNAAKMRYYQAFGTFVPQISASTAIGQDLTWNNNLVNPMPHTPGRDFTVRSATAVNASWLLFDGLAREFSFLIAQHGVKLSEADKMKVQCMVKEAVAYAYEDIQYANAVENIQKRNRDFQLMMYNIVDQEFSAKKTRPQDEVLNFKIMETYASASITDAIYQRETANYSLAVLMGYPEGVLPGMAELPGADTRIRPLPFDVEVAIDLALKNNPKMHIMEETLKIAQYNQYKSYSAFMPTITAYSDFSYTAYTSQFKEYANAHTSASTPAYSYGIRADYMIFNGLARYNRMREAQALYAMNRFQMAETYLQTINDTRAAYANYQNRAQQATYYRNLYQTALEQRNLVEKRYRNYDVTVDRMNEVQTYYINTELEFASQINQLNKSIALLEAILMVPIFTD